MNNSRLSIAAALIFCVSACKDDPSFVMRWSLDGEVLEHSPQCSERGVLTIEAQTYDAFGVMVDMRRFPCFVGGFENPDRRVNGPTLPAGPYAVKLFGTNRALTPWIDDATLAQEQFAAQAQQTVYDEENQCLALAGEPRCRAEELVCDCLPVEVADEQTIDLADFAIGRPPQCNDGIDNDRDGLVDVNDPACVGGFGFDTLEGRSVSASEFDLRVSFLDHNPLVGCGELGISRLEVRLQDEPLVATTSCDLSLRFSAIIDESLADGPAVDGQLPVTLWVHALDAGGDAVAEPVPVSLTVPLDLGGFYVLQADFPGSSFAEPIMARSRFIVGYASFDGAPTRFCAPVATDGFLQIDRVRISWLNAHGGPLDPPLTLPDGTALDGSEQPCPAGVLTTPLLEWGDYLVGIEALSAEGDVCFSNLDAPSRAAPSETFGVVLPRVSATGSCRDCDTDADCSSWSCVEGVCQP